MTDPDYACPSLLELEELKLGLAPDEAAEQHLAGCPRCRALLGAVGNPAPQEQFSAVLEHTESSARNPRPSAPDDVGVHTGALWRALPDRDADFAWVVAIIGRSPDNPDALLVAPVSGPPQMATDKDLLLEAKVLGYPAFLDMTNLGTVLREQLLNSVAELARPQAEAMVAFYRDLVGGAPAPGPVATGPAAVNEADPRLLQQAGRADALQELWRPAHLLVEDQDNTEAAPVQAEVASSSPSPDPAEVTGLLSTVLAERLEGAQAEWNRTTLLEASGADGNHLDGFLKDRLQLTDKGDVDDLARVLGVLEITWEQAEPAVLGSLQRSAGGERRANGADVRMAARSRAGADKEQTAKDLYADRTQVDQSAAARSREINIYLSELKRAVEELE